VHAGRQGDSVARSFIGTIATYATRTISPAGNVVKGTLSVAFLLVTVSGNAHRNDNDNGDDDQNEQCEHDVGPNVLPAELGLDFLGGVVEPFRFIS